MNISTENIFDVKGKKAIVTGSTRGLGYGMAEGLMEAGAEVVIVGTSDRVFTVADDFKDRGFACHAVKGNLAVRDEVYRVFRESVAALGGIWISWLRLMESSVATVQKNSLWKNGMKF